MNANIINFLISLFLLGLIGIGTEARAVEQINSVSVTDVVVPGTNGGEQGNYTFPKVLLQPNDTVTIEGVGGSIDFSTEYHLVPEDAGGIFWYTADASGFPRLYYDDPSNQVLAYYGEYIYYLPPDPIITFNHAGLFLPAHPGAVMQPIGLGTKTFTFTGTSPQYLKLGVNDRVWQNNDGQFLARVTVTRKSVEFTAAHYSLDENGGNAVISVSRSDSAGAMSVNYAASNGTATVGQDYTATSGTLNFAGGETTKTFNVPIINDTAVESNETVNLTLSAPTNGFTLGVVQTSVLTINDNDTTNNNSAFVTQNVPSQMYAGQTYDVMVAFKNTGTTVWAAGTYGLSSQNPLDNTTWGFNRVNLQSAVAPGATAFVNFTLTAPTTPGTYNFQWKTWQSGVAHFGAFSPNLQIEVLPRPTATVTDAIVSEGDTGQKQLTFVISLSAPMFLKALEIRTKINSPMRLHSAIELAMVRNQQGNHKEAEIIIRQNGSNDPVGKEAIYLANILIDGEKLAEAENLLREQLSKTANDFGKDHIIYAEYLKALGKCLKLQKRTGEAETFLRESYEIFLRIYGENHPQTIETKDLLNN